MPAPVSAATASIIGEARFLDRKRPCRVCGDRSYTVRELNVSPGQDFRCYLCFDLERTLYDRS